MGRLLAALIADFETAPAANPANSANHEPETAGRFAGSQDSHGLEVASQQVARLLAAIRTEYLEADLLGRFDAIPDELALLDDRQIAIYARMLHDTDLRERGKVPVDENAAALCRHCGPIWLHPAVASVAPIIDGWARVLGCSWCHVKNRDAMPRPLPANQST